MKRKTGESGTHNRSHNPLELAVGLSLRDVTAKWSHFLWNRRMKTMQPLLSLRSHSHTHSLYNYLTTLPNHFPPTLTQELQTQIVLKSSAFWILAPSESLSPLFSLLFLPENQNQRHWDPQKILSSPSPKFRTLYTPTTALLFHHRHTFLCLITTWFWGFWIWFCCVVLLHDLFRFSLKRFLFSAASWRFGLYLLHLLLVFYLFIFFNCI